MWFTAQAPTDDSSPAVQSLAHSEGAASGTRRRHFQRDAPRLMRIVASAVTRDEREVLFGREGEKKTSSGREK